MGRSVFSGRYAGEFCSFQKSTSGLCGRLVQRAGSVELYKSSRTIEEYRGTASFYFCRVNDVLLVTHVAGDRPTLQFLSIVMRANEYECMIQD